MSHFEQEKTQDWLKMDYNTAFLFLPMDQMTSSSVVCTLCFFDPPGRIGGHFFTHDVRTYVRPFEKQKRSMTDIMCEDDDHYIDIDWGLVGHSNK